MIGCGLPLAVAAGLPFAIQDGTNSIPVTADRAARDPYR